MLHRATADRPDNQTIGFLLGTRQMAQAPVAQASKQEAPKVVIPPQTTAQATKRKPTEVTEVKMTDGRVVSFSGNRKVLKETILDEGKIKVVNGRLEIADGAVAIRMDFRNGETRKYPLRLDLIPRFAGHGAEQKYGDELATPADKPMTPADMLLAVDDLHDQLFVKGEWRVVSEGGGGFAGASIVVQAIVEASGKSLADVKAYLQKKLDDAKARNEKLSRKELYDSFRNPNSKTGKIIKRMEEEALSKGAKVDADAALAELG
jgi:hypothetical protein